MKLRILGTDNVKIGEMELPDQFSEHVDPSLIKRAVEVLQAARRQPYGADPEAGKRASAKLSRRRHNYKSSYGRGISRVPRKVMSHSGTQFNFTGAFAPGTVGGRRAHPPKAEKQWAKKMNKKERQKALRSALAATMQRDTVAVVHPVPETYPFAVDAAFENLARTKDMVALLEKFGLAGALVRAQKPAARAGRGRLRGRRSRVKKSLLIVVSQECGAMKAARNIPGVDVVPVTALNAELLAPGSVPGRAALFSKAAIEKIGKEKLFTTR